jgi:xanthine dehydrogenase/oxidase
MKAVHPDAKLIVGNTEVGIEMKFKAMHYPFLIGATHVKELNAIRVTDSGVSFGASVTITRLLETCKQLVTER